MLHGSCLTSSQFKPCSQREALACFCVLGRGPELQESGAVTAGTETRSCTIPVAREAQWSSPVPGVQSGTPNYASESQVCFLGQVESSAGNNSVSIEFVIRKKPRSVCVEIWAPSIP